MLLSNPKLTINSETLKHSNTPSLIVSENFNCIYLTRVVYLALNYLHNFSQVLNKIREPETQGYKISAKIQNLRGLWKF